MNAKVVSKEKLKRIISGLKSKGKRIVFTNGCFDLLHVGHTRYLKKARSYGDALVVALNSDRSVKRLKGNSRPILNQKDRAEILSELECVSYVTIFNEDTPAEIIKYILPDVLVKGADYKIEDIVGNDTVTENGGKVVAVSLVKGKSTSVIIAKIKNEK